MKRFVGTVVIGYVLIMVAIFFRPKTEPSTPAPSQEIKKKNLREAMLADEKAKSSKVGGVGSGGQAVVGARINDKKSSGGMKVYHLNGNLSAEWQFDKVRSASDWYRGLLKIYYGSGQLWIESLFKNGKQDGLTRSYYPNGILWEEFNYKDGQYDGLQRRYYQSGVLWAESYYDRGKLQLRPRIFSENKKEATNISVSSVPPSVAHPLDMKGQTGAQRNPAKGDPVRSEKSTYGNGAVSCEWNTLGNLLEGQSRSYYPNGLLWSEVVYHENRPVGSYRMYDQAGRPWVETTHSNDGLRELTTVYYPSGQICVSFDHRSAKPDVIPKMLTEKSDSERNPLEKLSSTFVENIR